MPQFSLKKVISFVSIYSLPPNIIITEKGMTMKQKIKQFSILGMVLLIMFALLQKNGLVFEATSRAFDLWKNNLVPVMLPFFVLADILINYNFVYYLTKGFSKITSFLFHLNPACTFIFFMSIFSGFPSNAKYIHNLYDQGLIDQKDASKIVLFSHFSNPLFLLGTIGLFLGDTKIAMVILIAHYSTNVILGVLLRNYCVSWKQGLPKPLPNKPFIKILGSSIINAINTLLLILGTIAFFLILSTILVEILHISSLWKGIFTGILEMSSGVKYIALSNELPLIKATIISMILSFGGFAIHIQTFSILEDMNIKYLPYLATRIAHALIAGFLTFTILLRL